MQFPSLRQHVRKIGETDGRFDSIIIGKPLGICEYTDGVEEGTTDGMFDGEVDGTSEG